MRVHFPVGRGSWVVVPILLAIANLGRAQEASEPTWTPAQRSHWAFVPPRRVEPPVVKNRGWVRNPIDAFLLAGLEDLGIEPAAEADRATLIRRLRFDLTGLPPTPEEVNAFATDSTPDAYERLVDRLLESPAYGERWGRHWLDLARYAESDGFKNDKARPDAWRYRDWVVRALNADLPYDRFVALQLAGDLIAPGDAEAFLATGFNRNWPFEDNNMVPGLNRQLMLDDMTDTTASVVLGLTVACARCHDHKYDPISQRDYYRIQALFGTSDARDDFVLAPREAQAEHARIQAEQDVKMDAVRREVEAIEHPFVLPLLKDKLAKLPPDLREAFETDPKLRTPAQESLIQKNSKKMAIEAKAMMAAMPLEVRSTWQTRKTELDTLAKQGPPPLPTASGIAEAGHPGKLPPVRMLRKGNFAQPGETVAPGFLSVLVGEGGASGSIDPGVAPRKALADWVVSPANPLTARVIVNRLWHDHFGRGLVATTSDFGTQGEAPSHPELLDWLATELVARGWSLKAMHRLMVTSSAYRQGSIPRPETVANDPDNLLVSRMPRRRLEGEAVRDALLSVSGQLDTRLGGPSVYPDLPPGVDAKGAWPRSPLEADRNRRSLYVFVKRNLKYPLFDAFDVPDTNLTCPERNVSVNAPQALMLLNASTVIGHARALAGQVLGEVPDHGQPELVTRAYERAFGRVPTSEELEQALQFLRTQPDLLSGRDLTDLQPTPAQEGLTPVQGAALVDFCHVLLNLNEFVFVD